MNFAFPKPQKAIKDNEYMAEVAQLPCVICQAFGFIQTSPTEVHHPIHGRYSQIRVCDSMVIPLCKCHHTGLLFDRDRNKIAIHRNPEKWLKEHGPDTDYIAITRDRVERLNVW